MDNVFLNSDQKLTVLGFLKFKDLFKIIQSYKFTVDETGKDA